MNHGQPLAEDDVSIVPSQYSQMANGNTLPHDVKAESERIIRALEG